MSPDIIDNNVKKKHISWRKNQNKGSLQDTNYNCTNRDAKVMQKRQKSIKTL